MFFELIYEFIMNYVTSFFDPKEDIKIAKV